MLAKYKLNVLLSNLNNCKKKLHNLKHQEVKILLKFLPSFSCNKGEGNSYKNKLKIMSQRGSASIEVDTGKSTVRASSYRNKNKKLNVQFEGVEGVFSIKNSKSNRKQMGGGLSSVNEGEYKKKSDFQIEKKSYGRLSNQNDDRKFKSCELQKKVNEDKTKKQGNEGKFTKLLNEEKKQKTERKVKKQWSEGDLTKQLNKGNSLNKKSGSDSFIVHTKDGCNTLSEDVKKQKFSASPKKQNIKSIETKISNGTILKTNKFKNDHFNQNTNAANFSNSSYFYPADRYEHYQRKNKNPPYFNSFSDYFYDCFNVQGAAGGCYFYHHHYQQNFMGFQQENFTYAQQELTPFYQQDYMSHQQNSVGDFMYNQRDRTSFQHQPVFNSFNNLSCMSRPNDVQNRNLVEIKIGDKNRDKKPQFMGIVKRKWEKTHFGKTIEKNLSLTNDGVRFKLMSYNVLAQDLVDMHRYLYKEHEQNYLAWDVRWKNLMKEITEHDCDILCLQEVQESHLEKYYDQLKTYGYLYIYKKRTGIRTDGCAIFYKNSKFNLVEYAAVEFYQPGVSLLNRDNIALIAKFSSKGEKNGEVIVTTTHLLYNPKREDVRLAQLQVLLAEIDRIAYIDTVGENYIPIILTGDFNTKPNSVIYRLVTSGTLAYENLSVRRLEPARSSQETVGKIFIPPSLKITDNCQHMNILHKRLSKIQVTREEELNLILSQKESKNTAVNCSCKRDKDHFGTGTLSHNLCLKSAYLHSYGSKNCEATTYQDDWITVDYIFYSGKKENQKVKDNKLKLISRYRLPFSKELDSVRIPNKNLGSDHLALVTEFLLEY